MRGAAVALALAAALPAQRPDVVVFLADDLGFSDVGCYGSEIPTPSIDALAQGGLRFTQFYNTARCCPTRASLLTGLYPHRAGVGHMMEDRGHDGYRGDLNRRCATIAEVLGAAGYATAMVGKWHVTKATAADGPKDNWPTRRGFARFWGTIHGAGSYYRPGTLTDGEQAVARVAEGFYYTDALGERAARMVAETDRGVPLFLYVAFTAPHWPLHAPEADVARFAGRYDDGWDEVRARRHRRQVELGVVDRRWPPAPRDERAEAWVDVADKDWHARRMEVYAAQVAAMDRAIGRVVAALRARGRFDDTLLLFLADNGGCAEEVGARWRSKSIPTAAPDGGPMRVGNDPAVMPGPADTYQSYGLAWAGVSSSPFRLYKHWVHEGGIATPCVVHWPRGVAAAERGGLCHQPAHVVDVMATCAAVAEAAYPPPGREGNGLHALDGVSLLPALAGEELAERAIFFEHEGNRAVRRGRFKLVARGSGGAWELYDMAADRTELRDLAAEQAPRASELAALWQAWAERSDVLPLDPRPSLSDRTRFELTHGADLPRERAPAIAGRAFRVRVEATVEGDGVLVAQGGSTHGWALFVDGGRLRFAWRANRRVVEITADEPLPLPARVRVEGGLAADGAVTVRVGDVDALAGRVPSLLPAMPGEGLQVGRDDGSAVGGYAAPFALRGEVHAVVIELGSE